MNIDPAKTDWHYLVGQDVRGPVSLVQLKELLTAGKISENTLVAAKGSADWQPVSELLADTTQAPPLPEGLPPLPKNAGAKSKSARGILDQIGDTLNTFTETEKLEGFSLSEMFSEIFQKRTVYEMENYFTVGTELTTPKITEVQTGWPKPWLFMRLLMFFAVVYSGFVVAYRQFDNSNLIPGLILMGAFAMPITTLVLFFELNTPRNVSVYRLMVLVGLGGIVSLVISLIGYKVGHLEWMGAASAGIIEELGKLAALIFLVRGPRYRYILNGLLLGAAVGAGFAAFESAGYAFNALAGGNSDMFTSILLRAFLAPFGHVAWTAMIGAALWRVKGPNPVQFDMFLKPRFYRILLVAIALHMIWDMPILNLPFFLKEIGLGIVGWFVVWSLVQQGLRQVRDEQRAAGVAV